MAEPIIVDDNGQQVQPALRIWDKDEKHDLGNLGGGYLDIKKKVETLMVYDGLTRLQSLAAEKVSGFSVEGFSPQDREDFWTNIRGYIGADSLALRAGRNMHPDNRDVHKFIMPVYGKVFGVWILLRGQDGPMFIPGRVSIHLEF